MYCNACIYSILLNFLISVWTPIILSDLLTMLLLSVELIISRNDVREYNYFVESICRHHHHDDNVQCNQIRLCGNKFCGAIETRTWRFVSRIVWLVYYKWRPWIISVMRKMIYYTLWEHNERGNLWKALKLNLGNIFEI